MDSPLFNTSNEFSAQDIMLVQKLMNKFHDKFEIMSNLVMEYFHSRCKFLNIAKLGTSKILAVNTWMFIHVVLKPNETLEEKQKFEQFPYDLQRYVIYFGDDNQWHLWKFDNDSKDIENGTETFGDFNYITTKLIDISLEYCKTFSKLEQYILDNTSFEVLELYSQIYKCIPEFGYASYSMLTFGDHLSNTLKTYDEQCKQGFYEHKSDILNISDALDVSCKSPKLLDFREKSQQFLIENLDFDGDDEYSIHRFIISYLQNHEFLFSFEMFSNNIIRIIYLKRKLVKTDDGIDEDYVVVNSKIMTAAKALNKMITNQPFLPNIQNIIDRIEYQSRLEFDVVKNVDEILKRYGFKNKDKVRLLRDIFNYNCLEKSFTYEYCFIHPYELVKEDTATLYVVYFNYNSYNGTDCIMHMMKCEGLKQEFFHYSTLEELENDLNQNLNPDNSEI